MLFSAIPQYFFRKTDEWFGPSCQATNMRYRHSEVSLFPFIQAERRMKRYEKPDTSFRAMHSQGRADKPGFSELQCHDSALGLTTWWWGVQSKHVYFAWQQHAASCCLLLHLKGKLCVYFHACDVHYFHTMAEILCQFYTIPILFL